MAMKSMNNTLKSKRFYVSKFFIIIFLSLIICPEIICSGGSLHIIAVFVFMLCIFTFRGIEKGALDWDCFKLW